MNIIWLLETEAADKTAEIFVRMLEDPEDQEVLLQFLEIFKVYQEMQVRSAEPLKYPIGILISPTEAMAEIRCIKVGDVVDEEDLDVLTKMIVVEEDG